MHFQTQMRSNVYFQLVHLVESALHLDNKVICKSMLGFLMIEEFLSVVIDYIFYFLFEKEKNCVCYLSCDLYDLFSILSEK